MKISEIAAVAPFRRHPMPSAKMVNTVRSTGQLPKPGLVAAGDALSLFAVIAKNELIDEVAANPTLGIAETCGQGDDSAQLFFRANPDITAAIGNMGQGQMQGLKGAVTIMACQLRPQTVERMLGLIKISGLGGWPCCGGGQSFLGFGGMRARVIAEEANQQDREKECVEEPVRGMLIHRTLLHNAKTRFTTN